MNETVEHAAGMAEAAAEKADEAMRRGLDEAAEQARRATDGLGAVMQSGAILAGAAQTASQEWLSYAQGAALRNMQAMGSLARCRTMREVMAAQSGRFAEEMDEFIQSSRRISGRMLDAAEHAAGAIGESGRRL
jgi:hypothetical protein